MSSTNTVGTRWTTEEFNRLVLGIKPKIAVFDCDGTLWNGDSGRGFMVWSMEQGLVSRSTCDWIDTRYRAYLGGAVTEAEICGNMVQMYAGLREDELRSAAIKYFDNVVRGREFAEIKALVTSLRQTGTELWAVSSTKSHAVTLRAL